MLTFLRKKLLQTLITSYSQETERFTRNDLANAKQWNSKRRSASYLSPQYGIHEFISINYHTLLLTLLLTYNSSLNKGSKIFLNNK